MNKIFYKSLLIELFIEELPHNCLMSISNIFSDTILKHIISFNLISGKLIFEKYTTPRRIGILIKNVKNFTPKKNISIKLLPVSISIDKNGMPTQLLIDKLNKIGFPNTNISHLKKIKNGMNEIFYLDYISSEISLSSCVQEALNDAISVSKISIYKTMIYKNFYDNKNNAQFIRPIRNLIAMHGESIIPVSIFGIYSKNFTYGHRFLCKNLLVIKNADDYSKILLENGYVIPNFSKRKEKIYNLLINKSGKDTVIFSEKLLNDVTSLVEWPIVYSCKFDDIFLKIPKECLIYIIQVKQQYFALTDNNGNLCSRFLIVSNIETNKSKNIIEGNNNVICSRLTDVQFFLNCDKKYKLLEKLKFFKKIVYHSKLGSQFQRIKRIEKISIYIALIIGENSKIASLAARLSKADLLSFMVNEYPELQGIMGSYYAINDGENKDASIACKEHYLPLHVNDNLPMNPISIIVSLADKLESIYGIWGIGIRPTGDKDPFLLKRNISGILRILVDKKLPINFISLLKKVYEQFYDFPNVTNSTFEIYRFCIDRLHVLLKNQGYNSSIISSVLSLQPNCFKNIKLYINSIKDFIKFKKANELLYVNKRIYNILNKFKESSNSILNTDLFKNESEKILFIHFQEIKTKVDYFLKIEEYTNALIELTNICDLINLFFKDVMINSKNIYLKNNRIALLNMIYKEMNCICDISKLTF